MPTERSDSAASAGVAGAGGARVWLWVALLLAVVLHLYGLYRPGEPGESEWFPQSDKVLHLLGFAAPSTLAVLVFRHWWPIVVFAAHAVVSEVAQAWWLPGRDGDLVDVLADLSGLLPAVTIWWWLQRRGSRPSASATADSSPTSRTSAAARRPNA